MAHVNMKDGYALFVEKINRNPMGAHRSESMFRVLQAILGEEEAALLAKLPFLPFTLKKAAALWGKSLLDTEKILLDLAERGLMFDLENQEGRRRFFLPPPMVGFLEIMLMKVREDMDQAEFSRLMDALIDKEGNYIRDIFMSIDTKTGRVFANENVLAQQKSLEIFDYEKAAQVIKKARYIAVGMCYCRHKKEHLGKACKAPMDTCLSFNAAAQALVKHKQARMLDTQEALEILEQSQKANLVQIGENVQENLLFMCNCCGCCCDFLQAMKKYGSLTTVSSSNFVAQIREEDCIGCSACVRGCPVQAIASEKKELHPGKLYNKAKVDSDSCLGCGVCGNFCKPGAFDFLPRAQRVFTPVNTAHRILLNALESGTLPYLFLNTGAKRSHHSLANLIQNILNLPPIKRALANEQLRSRYLARLLQATDILK